MKTFLLSIACFCIFFATATPVGTSPTAQFAPPEKTTTAHQIKMSKTQAASKHIVRMQVNTTTYSAQGSRPAASVHHESKHKSSLQRLHAKADILSPEKDHTLIAKAASNKFSRLAESAMQRLTAKDSITWGIVVPAPSPRNTPSSRVPAPLPDCLMV